MVTSTWNDWFDSRVYFLTNWAHEPIEEARRIAQNEMTFLGGPILYRPKIADRFGKFMDVNTDAKPFKGARKAKRK
jgi:hypothetical protein